MLKMKNSEVKSQNGSKKNIHEDVIGIWCSCKINVQQYYKIPMRISCGREMDAGPSTSTLR